MADELVVRDVVKTYAGADGPVQVLSGASLAAAPGDTIAIVGPSGSGKSTLLNIIGSLDSPDSGTVTFRGTDIPALKGTELAAFRAKEVGFIFQDHHLLPQLTALENVLLPSIPAGRAVEAEATARTLLERMGVARRADAFPAQMSGGERQRTAVARALVNGAKLLLCDEPTGSLDRDSGSNLISLLKELAAQQQVTVIVVTHNMEHAGRLGRGMELQDGRLVPLEAHASK